MQHIHFSFPSTVVFRPWPPANVRVFVVGDGNSYIQKRTPVAHRYASSRQDYSYRSRGGKETGKERGRGEHAGGVVRKRGGKRGRRIVANMFIGRGKKNCARPGAAREIVLVRYRASRRLLAAYIYVELSE